MFRGFHGSVVVWVVYGRRPPPSRNIPGLLRENEVFSRFLSGSCGSVDPSASERMVVAPFRRSTAGSDCYRRPPEGLGSQPDPWSGEAFAEALDQLQDHPAWRHPESPSSACASPETWFRLRCGLRVVLADLAPPYGWGWQGCCLAWPRPA